MSDTIATSFGVLNYSGALFNKGNTRTPLSSIIGSRAKTTNSVEFVVGQSYAGGGNRSIDTGRCYGMRNMVDPDVGGQRS